MSELRELVEAFETLQILVMGDPMYDFYHFGHVDRLSPEAPVPIYIEDRHERRPGGAANVANQLTVLGCMVETWFPPKPWTEKHRYMAGHHQVVRMDRDYKAEEMAEHDSVPPSQCRFNAMVISDYGKGFVTRQRIKYLLEAAVDSEPPQHPFIVVDPKGTDWTKYIGCDVICPNQAEYAEAEALENQLVSAAIVEKRAEQGIRLWPARRQKPPKDFPAYARHVYDVTGAGDTVTAVVAATLATGGTLEQACILANMAAGYVVGEVGTSVCPASQLKEMADGIV